MASPASVPLVLITGATGYIGAHVARYVLSAGWRVRCTVRTLSDDTKYAALRGWTGPTGEKITFVPASLTSEDGWADAVAGCTYIIHVASPVPVSVAKEEDVVGPAVSGVRHVLTAALAQASVKRVVLTSSTSAVCEGRTEEWNTHTFTSEDWTEETKAGMYPKSKKLAEQEAWRMIRDQPPGRGLELAVINPGFVFGPALQRDIASSGEMFRRLFNGDMPMVPDLSMTAVDVRDVALGHLRAMVRPEAAGKRFIFVESTVPLRAVAAELAAQLNPIGYSIPTWPLPSWVMHVMAWFDSSLGMVTHALGKTVTFDTSPSTTVLGVPQRPARPALLEMAYSMIALGSLPDRTHDHRLSQPDVAARFANAVPAPEELVGSRPEDVASSTA